MVLSFGVVAAAVSARVAAPVRPGITVLLTDSTRLVAGKRVGLLSNQTGVDRAGTRDVDLLRSVPSVHLVRLFSPEHGFGGALDRPVTNSSDSGSGLPIYSLYAGPHTPAPPLDGLDAVLIDLQDIGARYYTYVASAVILMQHAARRGIPVIVLDRPDPIGGVLVQGNVRAKPAPATTLISFLPVPMRPGMTLGELLRFANDTLRIHARLTIVPVAGWRREMYYDQTGLPWVRPSPAMPDLESAMHYPGTCLFEGTNLSVGRGTAVPFQVVGAPWLRADAILKRFQEAGERSRDVFRGVELSAGTITPVSPTDNKYGGVRVNTIRLRVTDRRTYDPTRTAVALLVAIRASAPDSFAFLPDHFDLLAGGPELRQALQRGRTGAAIWREWEAPLARFREARGKYLLY